VWRSLIVEKYGGVKREAKRLAALNESSRNMRKSAAAAKRAASKAALAAAEHQLG